VIALIDEACEAGARLSAAWRVLAISARTLQRWREEGRVKADGRRQAAAQREPANKLSEQERRRILDVANEPQFAAMAPSQIVPALADRGLYLASESSFYRVFHKAHLREGIGAEALVLHSDNGSPMKGATMLSTLQRLGVMPSFSRPSVSDDNPFSEALFKTLKYHPGFPDKPFESLQEARQWVAGFQQWYNEAHRHSALKFVTPAQRHRGEDTVILQQRHALYEAAKVRRPERWSGPTRNWEPEKIVYLNPGKPMKTEDDLKQNAA
jgi:transposase InsO family protein